MDILLNTDFLIVVEKAEMYCAQEGIEIELVYKLPEKKLEIISERSKELPSLFYVSVDLLRKRIENGCFILIKDNIIYGHIFAHEHLVRGYSVFERSCLWVNRDFRNYNLGLLLMSRMTELFTESFMISIAQTPKVHHYNQLLGMTHITLAQMSKVLVEELEKLGKLRDELSYKYFVNPCFEAEIRKLK
jgi:hypothetical protein